MRPFLRYQKSIGFILLLSFYWLCMPQLPAQAAMVTTEDALDRDLKFDSDRARIKAFVSRKDVIVQLRSYGISSEEALARVDSLTDQEITLIAGKLDQLPTGGFFPDAFYYGILIVALIGAVIMLIIAYALEEGPNKPTYKKF